MLKNVKEYNLYNHRAEQILLGAAIVHGHIFEKISEFLLPEHFYEQLHGEIYKVISNLFNKNITPTVEFIETTLKNNQNLQEVGGAEYLFSLTKLALIEIDPYSHGKLIYELAKRRHLIELAHKIALNASNVDVVMDADQQIQEAEGELFKLAFSGGSKNGFSSFAKSLQQSLATMNAAMKNPSHINGITTGLVDMDKKLAGFQPSDLVIIAARPSMGKTALAINLAVNAALAKCYRDSSRNHTVGFFSLEMSSEQLSTRILSMTSEINSTNLKTGFINEEKYNIIRQISEDISKLNLMIDDTPALSISAIRTRARRLKRQFGLDILFIDYLQLIRPTTNSDNRVLEISEITQGLKALAKELDIPIIALSQLSRAVEQRVDKRPLLSDLRESGSIEQDADIVMFIYREEYYLSRSSPSNAKNAKEVIMLQEKATEVKNKAEVIVAKHRNGPIGEVSLHYNNDLGKFSNLTNKWN